MDSSGWRSIETCDTYGPVLIWDDYHGMVIAKRNASGEWRLDAPYAFEIGVYDAEFRVEPKEWQPLPSVPDRARRAKVGASSSPQR